MTLVFLRAVTLSESCSAGPSLDICVVTRQNQGNYTLPRHLWCPDSYLTWVRQPWHDPCKEEAKQSRSPTWRKLLRWKLNVRRTQHRGSDKMPRVLETGTAKKQLSRELRQLSLRFQKTSLLLWPEGRMPSKVLIPLQSLAPCLTPCFLEPPRTGDWWWGQLGALERRLRSESQRRHHLLAPVAVTQAAGGSSVLNLLWPRIRPMKTVSTGQVFSRFYGRF